MTKTWEELAKEAGGDSEFAKRLDGIPEGERASLGGPVDAGIVYGDWAAGEHPSGPMGLAEFAKGGAVHMDTSTADDPEAVHEFKKMIAEVLEKIPAETIFAVGDMRAIDKGWYQDWFDQWDPREYKEPLSKYRNSTAAVLSYLDPEKGQAPSHGGAIDRFIPYGIAFNQKDVTDWLENKNKLIFGHDGHYSHWETPITGEQQAKVIICHELAHYQLRKEFPGGVDEWHNAHGGHGDAHFNRMNALIEIIFPDLAKIARTRTR